MQWTFKGVGNWEEGVRSRLSREFTDLPSERLVREAIQNSLDAGVRDSAVRVRFGLSRDGLAASGVNSPYLEGLARHLDAVKGQIPGLSPPDKWEKLPFLAIEDFETRGLVGDWKKIWFPNGTRDQDYYYFIRSEGYNGKGPGDHGSWGYGKFVFHGSSDINASLFYTVRLGDTEHPRLLIGKTKLERHEIDGTVYPADGYFASPITSNLVPIFEKIR